MKKILNLLELRWVKPLFIYTLIIIIIGLFLSLNARLKSYNNLMLHYQDKIKQTEILYKIVKNNYQDSCYFNIYEE
jgi:hypothetical protein